MTIPTAVIGLGKIGLTYDLNELGQIKANQVMTHCNSVSKSDFFSLNYLIDTRVDVINRAINLYGGVGLQLLPQDASQDSPELVIISVPTNLHLETLLKVTNLWKPSVFLIEKPFGANSHEAQKMADVLRLQGARVYVNYVRRYLPNFLALKSSHHFMRRGQLNLVKIVGYGTLRNVFSHFFDLLLYLEDTSSLGTSKKSTTITDFGVMKFKDPNSGIEFELEGIGQLNRECEMKLVYDSIAVNITSNGRCIQISDLGGKQLTVFNLDKAEFNSYQAIVLKRIETDIQSRQVTPCLENAILVHQFIESI